MPETLDRFLYIQPLVVSMALNTRTGSKLLVKKHLCALFRQESAIHIFDTYLIGFVATDAFY